MKEMAAVNSNRKFVEPLPLRGDRNKMYVILESLWAILILFTSVPQVRFSGNRC